MQLLRTRDARAPETSRKYNQDYGVSALYFLGRLGYAPAREEIGKLLHDPGAANSMAYTGGAIAALLDIGEQNPPLRHTVAEELVQAIGRPGWDISARLKGTRDRMKSMAFPLIIASARRLASWGEKAMAEKLRKAARPSDEHEICKAFLEKLSYSS